MARRRPITVEDLWKLERLSGLSLSPDGAQAVCSVGRYSMDENSGRSELWLLSTLGGAPRRLTACGEKDGQPAWSPTGERIAFLARREQQGRKDETTQLYAIAPDGGEALRISDFAPGIESFKWFPDGRRIAFVAWVWPDLKGTRAQARRFQAFKDRKETAYVTSEAQYRHWDHHVPMGRVAHLHVLDTHSGRITDLFEGSTLELPRNDLCAHTYDVAPDGRAIAFVHDAAPVKRLDHCKTLSEIALRGGRVRALATHRDWDFEAPRYSPDGTQVAFTASHQGKRHTMPTHLAVVARDGTRWKALGTGWDRSVNAPLRWSADGAALYFTAEDRGRCHLFRHALAGRDFDIAVRGGWVQSFELAPDADGELLVTLADTLDHPPRAHAHRAGAAPLRLERFNDTLLASLELGTHEEITFTGAQREPVQMWLVHPPGFDRRKRYPVLHNIHGGPHTAAGDTFHFRWNTHVFAAQGYVVACVNYHGSSSFGFEFLDSITHRWGELELRDIEAATNWLLRQPWADRKRVFAAGGSYGGFMVAWMNAHVKAGRYRAYVCHAGCFDWTAMFADDAYDWHAKEVGAWYWDDPAKVDAQSPRAFAKAMATPTLVIHGALDYRVPDAQGLAYYNTLKAKGIDARLVWFPDENHWVLKPRNSRLWHEEFFAWLRRYDAAEGRPRRRARLPRPR